MNISVERLARNINSLTYELYKNDGFKNTSLIMSFDDAIKMDRNVMISMIDDLTSLLKKMGVNIPDDVRYSLDKDETLIKSGKIVVVENYMEISDIEYNKDSKVINAKTTDGNQLCLDSTKKHRNYDRSISLDTVFSLMKASIDHELKVNLYEINDTTYIFEEDQNKDIQNAYRAKIELFNEFLEAANYKIPVKNTGITTESFIKILNMLAAEENPVVRKIEAYTRNQETRLVDLLNVYSNANLNQRGTTLEGTIITML